MASSTASSPPTKRRGGRPRAQPSPAATDPREDILAAAAHLFSVSGYGGATTRDIANIAGLRQPSIFHYFPRKEDLLAELLDRTVQPTLDYVEWLRGRRARPEVKLFELIATDVQVICSGPYNLAALYLLPEARADRFGEFWEKRAQLAVYYQQLISDGHRSSVFDLGNVELATKFVFGTVESVAVWFDRSAGDDPATVGRGVAELVTRALLRDTTDLSAIRIAAADLRVRPGRPTSATYPFIERSRGALLPAWKP